MNKLSTLTSVAEYYQAGATNANSKLIQGQIISVSPIGAKHAKIVTKIGNSIDRLIFQNYNNQLDVRQQNLINIDNFSEPQPDIVVVKYREHEYALNHSTPQDIILIVEVADRTVSYDLQVKVPLYASANIPEIWVIDIQSEKCIVHRQLFKGIYQSVITLNEKEIVYIQDYPALSINLANLFGRQL